MCCSQYGYCGDTANHCRAGFQSAFGRCGGATSNTRAKLGSIPYGQSIYSCTVPGTIALTFDDGPYLYTVQLLDILAARGVKATFFVTYGCLALSMIPSPWAAVIRHAYNEGHQIASHIWDHADLNAALLAIIGRYPTYMRPPYIRCDGPCLSTMGSLGYHVIIWDLNTADYENTTPDTIQNAKNNVLNAIAGTNPAVKSFMSIAHDIHQQTVINLTGYQIDVGIKNGYRHVRLGECLGDAAQNWYRTS
ncbi:hypothetical protein RUND412_000549 [Rhizina undulata]